MGRKIQVISATVATLLAGSVFVGSFFAGDFVRGQVHDQVLESVVIQPVAGDTWTSIVDTDAVAPTYLYMSVFTLKNPDVVLNGGRPLVEEVGPFVYLQKTTIENVRVMEAEDSISFNKREQYDFVPELSWGSDDFMLTGPSVGLITALNMLSEKMSFLPSFFRTAIEYAIKSHKVFARKKVSDVVFGYDDELLVSLKKKFGRFVKELRDLDPRIGVLEKDTYHPTIKMRMGQLDPFRAGDMIMFDGTNKVTQFELRPDQVVEGTDSYRFHPFVEKNEKLKMYVNDFQKTFLLKRVPGAVKVHWPFQLPAELTEVIRERREAEEKKKKKEAEDKEKDEKKIVALDGDDTLSLSSDLQEVDISSAFASEPKFEVEGLEKLTPAQLLARYKPRSAAAMTRDKNFNPSRPLVRNQVGSAWRDEVLAYNEAVAAGKDTVLVNVPDKKGAVPTAPHPFQDFGGVKTVVFTPDEMAFGNMDAEYNNFFNPHGTQNVSAIRQGAPLFVSKPHFLHAHPSYAGLVDGLSPQDERHNSYFFVEPISGTCLGAKVALQISVLVNLTSSNLDVMGKKIVPYYHPAVVIGKVANATQPIVDVASEVFPVVSLTFWLDDNAIFLRLGAILFEAVVVALFVWRAVLVPQRRKRDRARKDLEQLLLEEEVADKAEQREEGKLAEQENQRYLAAMTPPHKQSADPVERLPSLVELPVPNKGEDASDGKSDLESSQSTMAPVSSNTLPLRESSLLSQSAASLPLDRSYFPTSSASVEVNAPDVIAEEADGEEDLKNSDC